jgi:hypothetical protein
MLIPYQKRKRDADESASKTDDLTNDTSKPTAIFKPIVGGRNSTLSIALPGSIIAKYVSSLLGFIKLVHFLLIRSPDSN